MTNDAVPLQEHLNRLLSEAPNGTQANDLLRRLTVFQGPFDAAAAVALAPHNMSEAETLNALVTLQQWGLLGRVAASEPLPIEARVLEAIPPQAETFATLQAWGFLERETVPTRYFLLKSILRALPPDDDALRRHYEYYRRMHGNITNNVQQERSPLINADWPNIHAALIWGMTHTRQSVFDFAWALNFYMRDFLARADWREIIEGLLHTAQQDSNLTEQANTLTTLGTITHLENDLTRAQSAYMEALTCYKDPGISTRSLTAKIAEDLVELHERYETAHDVSKHVRELPNVLRKEIQRLIVLYHLHDVQTKRRDFADARDLLLQMMDLYQLLRDEEGQCDTLTNMGTTAAQAGDMAQARDDFAWALRMGEGLSYAIGQMKTLWAWGQAEYQNGQKEAGFALCRQAIVVIMAAGVQDPRADEMRRQLAAMESETEIQARLQRMVAEEEYGEDALTLLTSLSVLSGPFSKKAISELAANDMSEDKQEAALSVLCARDIIQIIEALFQIRRDTERYILEDSFKLFISPPPDAHQRHFNHYYNRCVSIGSVPARNRAAYVEYEWQNIDQAARWGLGHDSHRAFDLILSIKYYVGQTFSTPWHILLIEALSIAETLNDLPSQAALLETIGSYDATAYDEIKNALERAAVLYQNIGDQEKGALVLGNLGQIAYREKDLSTARHSLQQALSFFIDNEDESGQIVFILDTLVNVTDEQGDFAEANLHLQSLDFTQYSRHRSCLLVK